MNHDHQTSQRAVNAALWGMAVQAALALAMGVLSLSVPSFPVSVLFYHLLGGLAVWGITWAYFNQQRLERLEALEAAALSRGSAAGNALFQQQIDELQVARRRLERLVRWGLPLVGGGLGLYLTVMGLVWLRTWLGGGGWAQSMRVMQLQAAGASFYSLGGALVAAAFVAFVAGRYVSGMTRVPEWTLLRGGAGYLMGSAALALLALLGALLAWLGWPPGLAAVSILVPALMALVGLEMLLALLLGFYRPRTPGQVARPAFDSRLLGWLSSPESLARIFSETVNYQFGIEVSRSWFYRLLSRAVTPLLLCGLAVLLLLSCLVPVGAGQQAIVTVNGRIVAYDAAAGVVPHPPGLHLKWPWPIARADLYDVGKVHQITIGSVRGDIPENIALLWTNQHGTDKEEYLLTSSSRDGWAPSASPRGPLPGAPTTAPAAGPGAFPDVSLLGGQVAIQYLIDDLHKYVTAAAEPERLLRLTCERRINAYFAGHRLEELLSAGRIAAGDELRRTMQADLDAAGLGIRLVYVNLFALHPPVEEDVASSFHRVIMAGMEVQSSIDQATQEQIRILSAAVGSPEGSTAVEYARRLYELYRVLGAAGDRAPLMAELARAGGEVAQSLHEARSYRWQREVGRLAELADFQARLAAFRQAPLLYSRRLEYLAWEELPADLRLYLIGSPRLGHPLVELEMTPPSRAIEQILSGGKRN